MANRLNEDDYSSIEATPNVVRTREEDLHLFEPAMPRLIPYVRNYWTNDSATPTSEIIDDDEKSVVFQEMLFTQAAISVLERNKNLFKELSKY